MNFYSETVKACEALLENAYREEQRRDREAIKFRRELAIWKAQQEKQAPESKPKSAAKNAALTADWSRMTLEERQLIISLRKRGHSYETISNLVGRPVETCRATFSRWHKARHRANARAKANRKADA